MKIRNLADALPVRSGGRGSLIHADHRDVSAAELAEELRRGAWRCFATPRMLDAVRVKVSRAARRAGMAAYRTLYEPERWVFTAFLPIVGGEEELKPLPRLEADDLRAVRELRLHARKHAARLRAELGGDE